MPNKYLKEEDTLLGSSAIILSNLNDKQSLSELWDRVKEYDSIYNFERFCLSLDLLYMLNVVDFKNDNIILVKK